jgi:two-component system, NtrC family, sensor kinase
MRFPWDDLHEKSDIMEQERYGKLRRLILAIMILVPSAPFIIVLAIGYYYFTTSLENSTIASLKRIVGDHRQMIEAFLTERKADLGFVVSSYLFEELSDPQQLYGILRNLQEKSATFVDLGIFNEEGIHVAYHGPYRLVGKDYSQEDWFRQVMKQGYYISDIFLGYRQLPHFIIALSIEEAGTQWVIRATIDTYMFTDLVEKVRIGKTGEAYILNAEGVFQTARRSGGNLMDPDEDRIVKPSPNSEIRTFVKKDSKGEAYLYATTWLKDKNWMLVVRQEEADAFRALRSASYMIIFVSLIGGGVIVAVAFYLTGHIIRRMERIDLEKDRLGRQLVRATQLAELGQMAAGFAHEINNPLQIMKSEQTLIDTIFSDMKGRGELKESEDLREVEDSMAQIKLQIDRCAKITQAILKFGRRSEGTAKDVDLVGFIPEVTAMIAKKASVSGITLKEDIEENTPNVHVDPSQLHQVLLNLFNNAIDAIGERHGSEGGELIISAGPDENGKIRISVKDNGCGISPEEIKKVFTPFFTTKPVGQGTGLGLSVCLGIIDSMGGVMEVSSEKGAGTTFTIRLPAAA